MLLRVTHARAAIPGSTEALVRRVAFRKAGLAPWDTRVEQAWLYALARAAKATQTDVNHTVLVLNHHHTTVTASDEPIRNFLGRLHHPMSCVMNRLLEQRGFDAFDTFWDSRQPHRMRLLDAAAQMSQLIYHQVQLVAAGMVDKPEDMPGWTFSWDLWRPGRFVRCRRPDVYFDPRFAPDQVDLRFVPPPLLLELFQGDVEKLIYWMKQLEQEAVRELRRRRRKEGRRVKGADYARRIHPWDEPRSRPNERGTTIPTFRLGARGIIGKEQRIRSCQEVKNWRHTNRACVTAWHEGERDVVFPYGTDKMRDSHNVQVAANPGVDALVYAPGPSLDDIRNRFGERRYSKLPVDARVVTEEVRRALQDEAPLFGEVSEALFHKQSAIRSQTSARPANATRSEVGKEEQVFSDDSVQNPTTRANKPVVVQTLHGPRRVSASHPPARIVVQRTRGRTGRRATDPPVD